MASQKPLKDITSKTQDAEVVMCSESFSSTEEMDTQDDIEKLCREEIQTWLGLHGPKLFALEASKFNAQEAKRKNIRGIR